MRAFGAVGHHRLTIVACVAAVLGVAHAAHAQQTTPDPVAAPSLRWQKDWPRFRASEYALTGALYLGALLSWQLLDDPTDGWVKNLVIDEAVRDALKLGPDGRSAARATSDIFLYVAVAAPFVLDDALLALGVHRNTDVTWQLLLMDAQSVGLTMFLTTLTKKTVGRARPFVPDCANNPNSDPECQSSDRFRSFLSGHSSFSFTGAGLVCAHHELLPLFANRTAGKAACYTALTLATTAGVLRIMGNMHHATDVLAGASVGIVSGYLLPRWLHFRSRDKATTTSVLVPYATPTTTGVVYSSTF